MANLIQNGAAWTPSGYWDGTKFQIIATSDVVTLQYGGAVAAGDVVSMNLEALHTWGEPYLNIYQEGSLVARVPEQPWMSLPPSYTSPPLSATGIVTIEVVSTSGYYGYELSISPLTPPVPVFESVVFVYTMNRTGQVGAWSRYVFPWAIDATAQLGETLFLRSGDTIYRVSEDATTDAGAPIKSIVQWPWLDFGTPGATKMLQTVDVVGEGPGTVSLQIGYDQRAVEAFTPAYTIPIDTLTGMPIPIPVSAPTLSVRLSFTGKWSLQAVNVNLAESRRTT